MRYESVKTSIWDDPDMQGWRANTKFLYFWFILNPTSHGLTGISRATSRQIKLHTSLTPKQQEVAFYQINENGHQRVARYEGGWYWLKARTRHACMTEHHWSAVLGRLREGDLPPELVKDFMERYTPWARGRGYPTDLYPTHVPPPSDPPRTPVLEPILSDSESDPSPIPIPKSTDSPPPGAAGERAVPAAPEPKAPSLHKILIQAFVDDYQASRGEPYQFKGGADGTAVKRLISGFFAKAADTFAAPLVEFKRRLAIYLEDEFTATRHCGLADFCARFGDFSERRQKGQKRQSKPGDWADPDWDCDKYGPKYTIYDPGSKGKAGESSAPKP